MFHYMSVGIPIAHRPPLPFRFFFIIPLLPSLIRRRRRFLPLFVEKKERRNHSASPPQRRLLIQRPSSIQQHPYNIRSSCRPYAVLCMLRNDHKLSLPVHPASIQQNALLSRLALETFLFGTAIVGTSFFLQTVAVCDVSAHIRKYRTNPCSPPGKATLSAASATSLRLLSHSKSILVIFSDQIGIICRIVTV